MSLLLRPLSFGEMLDRASSLALRTVLPLSGPVVILCASGYALAYLIIYVSVVYARVPGPWPVLLAFPFLFAAIVAALGLGVTVLLDAYFGRKARLARMLEGVRHTWVSLSMLFLLYFAILAVPAVALALFIGSGHWYVPFFGTPAGRVVGVGLILLALLLLVAVYGTVSAIAAISVITCAGEWAPPVESWMRGWERSMGRGSARKTCLYGALIGLGGFFAGTLIQLAVRGLASLFGDAPSTLVAVGVAVATLALQLCYVLFSWAFFIVYYVDLRVRSEGLDLAAEMTAAGKVGTLTA